MAWGLHPVSGTWSTSSSQGVFLLDNAPPPKKKAKPKWLFSRQRCFKFSANPTLTLGYDVQLCWHCVRRGSALWRILFCNVWFTIIMWGQWCQIQYSTVCYTTGLWNWFVWLRMYESIWWAGDCESEKATSPFTMQAVKDLVLILYFTISTVRIVKSWQ